MKILPHSYKLFDNLPKLEGFNRDDIIKQSQVGVYANTEGLLANQQSDRILTNAYLPLNAATAFDKQILKAVQAQTVLYSDMMTADCYTRYPFGAFAVTYPVSDLAEEPAIQMDFVSASKNKNSTQGKGDIKNYSVPVPIIYHDFDISARLAATGQSSLSNFGGFDITQNEITRHIDSVASATEKLLWHGVGNIKLNNSPLTGVLNSDLVKKNAVTIEFDPKNPEQFLNDFLDGPYSLLRANAKGLPGTFNVYHSDNLTSMFSKHYIQGVVSPTILQELSNIGGVGSIKPSYFLNPAKDPQSRTEGTLVLIKMNKTYIDIALEAELSVAQYASLPQLSSYIIFSACAPRVKQDYYGNIGVQLVNIKIKQS